MKERKKIKRIDLKGYRQKYMTVRAMSIKSDLSISTINNIEDSSKHLTTSSLFSYMNVLCTVLEENSIMGTFELEYTYDSIIYTIGFSRDDSVKVDEND